MKLGQHLFKKDQPIWGKPLLSYDPERMNQVFSEIPTAAEAEAMTSFSPNETASISLSLETELYLMLHSK